MEGERLHRNEMSIVRWILCGVSLREKQICEELRTGLGIQLITEV